MPKTILVADDKANVRNLLREYLEAEGFRVVVAANGRVTGLECQRMGLGEPDASGRRSPKPVRGSEFVMDVDTVVVAVGTRANPIVPATTPGLETNRQGYIVTKDESGATSREAVYAGGDIVTGSATVILAMGAGKKAARAIHTYLSKK